MTETMPQLHDGSASLTFSEKMHEERSWLDDGMWRNRWKALGGRVLRKEPLRDGRLSQSKLDSIGIQAEGLSQPGLMLVLSHHTPLLVFA